MLTAAGRPHRVGSQEVSFRLACGYAFYSETKSRNTLSDLAVSRMLGGVLPGESGPGTSGKAVSDGRTSGKAAPGEVPAGSEAVRDGERDDTRRLCENYFPEDTSGEVSLAEFEQQLSNLPCGFFVYSADRTGPQNFRYVSDSTLRLLGYPDLESFRDRFHNSFLYFVHADDRDRVMDEIYDQISSGSEDYCAYRVERYDGRLIWIYDRGRIVRAEDGRDYFYTIVMDAGRDAGLSTGNGTMEEMERSAVFLSYDMDLINVVIQYILNSRDYARAIDMVLALLGSRFHMSRVSVFEDNENHTAARCTFEWTEEGQPVLK